MDIVNIARVAHEVNKAYCESQGDFSQLIWEEAPEWQRDSAIAGVELHMASNVGPEISHENWRKHKLADGWVYGPVKDPEKKRHPCMVPFEELLVPLCMACRYVSRSFSFGSPSASILMVESTLDSSSSMVCAIHTFYFCVVFSSCSSESMFDSVSERLQ